MSTHESKCSNAEFYGAHLKTILQIARQHGFDATVDFIVEDLDEQTAKMVLAHVVNAILEFEKTHIAPDD